MKLGLEELVDATSVEHLDALRAWNAAKVTSGGQRGPSNYEELLKARALMPGAPADSRATERVLVVGDSTATVRVTAPQSGSPRAVLLDIHAGGFYLGSAAHGDTRNGFLADALRVVVVSVEYRLAPEQPWPAAPDDCEAAALWLIAEGLTEFGTSCILICGASSGSTLAAATLLRLRDRGIADRVAGTALQFGAYDLSGQTPGGRLYADEWFIDAYAGRVPDRTLPDVSPLYGDLRGLPPTLLVVGGADVLLEDNLAFAARLSAAGNDVELRVFPEAMHGFTSHATPMATAATDGIEKWLAARFNE